MRQLIWPVALCTLVAAPAPAAGEGPVVTVVTLGDSITKGVRAGVPAGATFSALVEKQLGKAGLAVRVVNMGVGGERAEQALKRLDAVTGLGPRVVTVMYGTNDSYIDPGKGETRVSRPKFRDDIRAIVNKFREQGIVTVLMTEPRHSATAPPNGLGENPNVRLGPFMDDVRAIAAAEHVPLVDHHARWGSAEAKGQDLQDWTTDGCHPNPRGHADLADALAPVLLDLLTGTSRPPRPAP